MKLHKIIFRAENHYAELKVQTFEVKETPRVYRILESSSSDFTVETIVHKAKIDAIASDCSNSLPCIRLCWHVWCLEEKVEQNKMLLKHTFNSKVRELKDSLAKFESIVTVIV